jgi:uncharacterized repeat protein (TIGR01451 family)
VAQASATVTVNNVDPSPDNLAMTDPIDEGDLTTLTGDITDPGTLDSFGLMVDWGDGMVSTYTYGVGTTNFAETHQYQDNGIFTATLTLTDDDSGSGTGTIALTVNGVDPTVTDITVGAEGTGGPINEGDDATLTGNIDDPSVLDSFTLLVDWGDGMVTTYTYPAGTLAFTETHTYLDDDPTGTPSDLYTVTLNLTDDDGGSTMVTGTVQVDNVIPFVDAGAPAAVLDTQPITLTGTYSDVGVLDTHTFAWDFGDGYTSTGSLTVTHIYTGSGVYTATLYVTDDDTGVGLDTKQVFVGALSDLVISKTDSSDPAPTRNPLIYTIVISNIGPTDATGVIMTDTLSSDVDFMSASPGCTESGGVVVCSIGDVASGTSVTLTVTVFVDISIFQRTDTRVISNTATVLGAEIEPNYANNTVTETTLITPNFSNLPIVNRRENPQ